MQRSSIQRSAHGWLILGTSLAVILALTLVSLGGCAAGKSGPTLTPTKTRMPTFTPAPPTATATAVPPTASATPLPSPTPAPTATPVPPTATPPTPTAAPPTPTQTPPPTAVPVVARPAPTAAPPTVVPVADPCAGIGGDGCKWKKTGGPSFGANNGLELKLQFLFIHSGRGGETQGQYFVVMEKDGQKLPISDSVRSFTGSASHGALGNYNYEYSLGVDKLPGGTIAGRYKLWVLDGEGVRDSHDFEFDVPANQGLLWIQFDQT